MSNLFNAKKFNPSDKTFNQLMTGDYQWWNNLKKNKNISIQIRQSNTIDVYYNGGAILSSLQYDVGKKEFTARIHPKYIPLEDEAKYQSLSLTSGGVKFPKEIKTMAFKQFDEAVLKAVMNRIQKYYGTESEKAIQFKFIANDPFIIDAEFQASNKMRIDLVRLDLNAKKIVLIEVKTIDDQRLFADTTDETKSIYGQLKKYNEFAKANSDSILEYYIKVLQTKKNLGLTKLDYKKLSIDNWQVEQKPLLVFGDCKQTWIDDNAASIDKRIKNVTFGAYYFGEPKYNLDLLLKSKKNQHIF